MRLQERYLVQANLGGYATRYVFLMNHLVLFVLSYTLVPLLSLHSSTIVVKVHLSFNIIALILSSPSKSATIIVIIIIAPSHSHRRSHHC